jgi:osmotically inducible lipoprotein OsmB
MGIVNQTRRLTVGAGCLMDEKNTMKTRCVPGVMFIGMALLFMVGCSSPLTTREQGGLIGAGVGAGTGAIIGSTVGHAAAGALIGGPVGLIAGALIGDQLMGREVRQDEQQRQIDRNAAELDQLRRENQRLREEVRDR